MPFQFFSKKTAIIFSVFCVVAVVAFFILPHNFATDIAFWANAPGGSYNQAEIQKILAKDFNSFSFAVISDSHVSQEGLSETFKKVLAGIDGKDYLFLMNMGDFASDGSEQEYQIYFSAIKSKQTPFLTALGNHDAGGGGRSNFWEIFGRPYYSFAYKSSLFIVLDDSNTQSVDNAQMVWLLQELKKDYRHKFVFMHVPSFDPRQGGSHSLSNAENAKALQDLFKEYKADAVFSGHIHAYYDEARNGVEYVITGGGGGSLVGQDPEHDFYNYVEVNVSGDNVTKKVIKIP